MLPHQKLSVVLAGFLVALWKGVEVDAFAVPAHRIRPRASSFRAAGEASAAPVESSAEGQTEDLPQALIFDCDGVLADTERDGHRPAFNAAFKIKNLGKGGELMMTSSCLFAAAP